MKSKNDSTDQLLRYLRGDMAPAERQTVETRLTNDRKSREKLALLRALRRLPASEEPSDLLTAAERLSTGIVAEYIAGLRIGGPPLGVPVFDSRLLPIPEGVRPATVDTCRLSYRLGDLEVDLSLYPISPERFEVIGQVFGWNAGDPLHIQLRTGRARQQAPCDSFGVFRFADVDAGRHLLALQSGKKTAGIIRLEL